MTLLLNHELISRVKLCLVSVFPDIVKDCPKIRNLPKIFLRSFENVAPAGDLISPRLSSSQNRSFITCSVFTLKNVHLHT